MGDEHGGGRRRGDVSIHRYIARSGWCWNDRHTQGKGDRSAIVLQNPKEAQSAHARGGGLDRPSIVFTNPKYTGHAPRTRCSSNSSRYRESRVAPADAVAVAAGAAPSTADAAVAAEEEGWSKATATLPQPP